MPTLFLRPATCSLAPHIALREAGAAFDTVAVDLVTKRTEDGRDYRTVAAKGQVPALLLEDGELLTEGPAISQYVADRHPDAALLPPLGTLAPYQALEWLNFGSAELHKAVGQLFAPNLLPEVRPTMIAQAQAKLAIVEAHLEERRWLAGDAYSLADILVFVIVSWLPMIGIDQAAYPNLTRHAGAVAARPAVQDALHAEGLV